MSTDESPDVRLRNPSLRFPLDPKEETWAVNKPEGSLRPRAAFALTGYVPDSIRAMSASEKPKW